MSLQARDVSYAVGGRCLVGPVALTAEVGEVLVLAGNNGAGKSTLLSLLAGCPSPSAGEVLLESRPLAAWSAAELAVRRAILPQSPSLAFDFRVDEVVRLGTLPHAADADEVEQRTREVMQWLDVARFAARGYFELSGGERQRVQLARVLLQACLARTTPRYLLLDEPLAALDLAHQYALMERLRHLAASAPGVGVVLVTHDLNIALRYADRICLLRARRCHATGKTAEVLTPGNIRAVFGVDAEVTKQVVTTRSVAADSGAA